MCNCYYFSCQEACKRNWLSSINVVCDLTGNLHWSCEHYWWLPRQAGAKQNLTLKEVWGSLKLFSKAAPGIDSGQSSINHGRIIQTSASHLKVLKKEIHFWDFDTEEKLEKDLKRTRQSWMITLFCRERRYKGKLNLRQLSWDQLLSIDYDTQLASMSGFILWKEVVMETEILLYKQ